MSGEKTFDATQHKIDEARKDGNVAISQDLMKSAVCVAAFEICRAMALRFDGFVHAYFIEFIAQLATVQQHRGFRADNVFMWIGASVVLSLLIGGVSVAVFVAMSWVQTGGPVIKKTPIEFKLDGLHPKNYFKKVFATKTLVDLATNLVKAAVVSTVLWFAVKDVVRQLPNAVPAGIEEVAALIGKEAVDGLFAAAPSYLRASGSLLVQTVHPVMACGEAPYIDGWRAGSWAGFSDDFQDAPPWYFRTVSSWIALFADHGLRLAEMREPLHPRTGKPVSLILAGTRPG